MFKNRPERCFLDKKLSFFHFVIAFSLFSALTEWFSFLRTLLTLKSKGNGLKILCNSIKIVELHPCCIWFVVYNQYFATQSGVRKLNPFWFPQFATINPHSISFFQYLSKRQNLKCL